MVRSTRRTFLNRFVTSAAAVAASSDNIPALLAQAPSPRGSKAGEERVIEGIRLCWCPPGRFLMGSPATEQGHRPDEAQIDVTLTRGFWTAKQEVTQGQWKRVIGAFPDKLPSPEFGEGDEVPAYWINFDEAEGFCAELTGRARRAGALPDGWQFSLPTEAQWEYACRAGTTTAFSFGDTLGQQQANIGGEIETREVRARGRSRPVGSYPANPWGIQDMHGNVWEWCRDYYHSQLPGGTDPDLSASKGLPNRDGTYSRVRRGGAWVEETWACRSACRLRYESHRRSDHIGFRVFVVERPAATRAFH
jgi:formylglycine-generating enzyme required for sulfatase activity